MATSTNKSAAKVFAILDVLWRNFVNGYAPGELAKATGLSPSDITRNVATLIEAGYAERIPETDRVRVSHSAAKKAVQILNNIDQHDRRLQEMRSRLMLIN